MRLDLDNLPSKQARRRHLVRNMAAVVEHRDGEIERLKSIIRQLQRSQFGRGSEWVDPDQLALASSPAIILLPMAAVLSRRT
ncbi:transposase [Mesorhizobium sp. M1406]|uniref:transposase n=1 Tax=Mesorhizobium sp. M1406 TaxID=2957099 RepID=UPI00333B1B12